MLHVSFAAEPHKSDSSAASSPSSVHTSRTTSQYARVPVKQSHGNITRTQNSQKTQPVKPDKATQKSIKTRRLRRSHPRSYLSSLSPPQSLVSHPPCRPFTALPLPIYHLSGDSTKGVPVPSILRSPFFTPDIQSARSTCQPGGTLICNDGRASRDTRTNDTRYMVMISRSTARWALGCVTRISVMAGCKGFWPRAERG